MVVLNIFKEIVLNREQRYQKYETSLWARPLTTSASKQAHGTY